MHRKKRSLLFLFSGLLSLILIFYFLVKIDPKTSFYLSDFLPVEIIASWNTIPSVYIFLALIFIFLFSLFTFLSRNKRRGIFIGAFVASYLILRLQNLTQFYFFIILLALFITLEITFSKQK